MKSTVESRKKAAAYMKKYRDSHPEYTADQAQLKRAKRKRRKAELLPLK